MPTLIMFPFVDKIGLSMIYLNEFMTRVAKYSLTLNKSKCHNSFASVDLLGYTISKGLVKPDSDRLKGLMDLPIPQDFSSLRQAMGMFSLF